MVDDVDQLGVVVAQVVALEVDEDLGAVIRRVGDDGDASVRAKCAHLLAVRELAGLAQDEVPSDNLVLAQQVDQAVAVDPVKGGDVPVAPRRADAVELLGRKLVRDQVRVIVVSRDDGADLGSRVVELGALEKGGAHKIDDGYLLGGENGFIALQVAELGGRERGRRKTDQGNAGAWGEVHEGARRPDLRLGVLGGSRHPWRSPPPQARPQEPRTKGRPKVSAGEAAGGWDA